MEDYKFPPPPPPAASERLRRLFSAVPLFSIAFAFLTVNAAVAAYRSSHDLPALSFIIFSYFDLLALRFLTRRIEHLGATGELTAEREARMMRAVLLLAGALFLGLGWRVAAIVPRPAQVVFWAATGSIAGGFVVFIMRD